MPDVGWLLLLLALAAAFVVPPLVRRSVAGDDTDAAEAAAVQYRVALDALRDVEADHEAGSLDEPAYVEQRAAAEERATVARAERDAAGAGPGRLRVADPRLQRLALGAAGIIGVALFVGSLLPAPLGLANATVVNEGLAAAQAAEEARQARIRTLLGRLETNPSNAATLSELADAYLAGSSRDDLARAISVLQAVIALDPQDADAFRRIITAYLRAGDYPNATAALDAYADADADEVDLAFFRGIIALRGDGDPQAAVAAFDEFLRLARDDDPRLSMVRGLRDEALAAPE